MHDTLRVCGLECVGNLNCQRQQFVCLKRLPGNPVLERLALQQLHGDEGPALGFVNVINRTNIRVVQGGGRLGFPLETLQRLMVLGEPIG